MRALLLITAISLLPSYAMARECRGKPPPKPRGECELVCNDGRWQWVCEPRNPHDKNPDTRNPFD